MNFVGLGIYYIRHAYVANVRMALANQGSAANSTHVIVWRDDNDFFDHMWLIEPVTNEANTYTIRNLSTGTYMDLYESLPANNTPVIGFQKTGNNNQKWIIRKEETNGRLWKLQSKATGTFMDLYNGGGSGTNVVGWSGSWKDTSLGHQHWLFERLSVTGNEVLTILGSSPYITADFKNYLSDGLYLIPTREQLSCILQHSELLKMQRRREIFDSDDFAIVFKAQVSKWGNASFKADGFAVLCGMAFGIKTEAATNEVVAHAYNWTLDRKDNKHIWFLEPQTGQYSEDACGYKAYFGLF